MSSAHNTAPLAALIASHPEECAAVLCALVVSGNEPATAQNVCFYLRHQVNADPIHAVVVAILSAMYADEAVTRATREGVFIDSFVLVAADRYAIARMGAAAWLRERVGPPTSTNPQNIGAARLCALAIEAAEIGALWGAAIAVKIPFPRTIGEYHDRLAQVAEQTAGLPMTAIDVEREVAAVWGRETGAQAPKGEQR